MIDFLITTLSDASVLALDDMRDEIQIDPDYQRPGGVWSRKKKQLFIDSILNRYDIPKFYFHHLTGPHQNDNYKYAIIDGRQRLEAIWDFIDGDYPLADDFVYLEDPSNDATGVTYNELSKKYPRLVTRFHSRTLAIQVVQADDMDFIEDMFSRLNEAVPLNAAEKRNAFGGPLPIIFRKLVKHPFFAKRIPIPTTRYRHHDIAAKLIYLESTIEIVDTKKASLDYFVTKNKKKTAKSLRPVVDTVTKILSNMADTFVADDYLLRSSGMVVVYYLLFSRVRRDGKAVDIKRKSLINFEKKREENRELFGQDGDGVDFSMIEYDELARSSNDGSAIRQPSKMPMFIAGASASVLDSESVMHL